MTAHCDSTNQIINMRQLKPVWSKFLKAINTFKLIEGGDKILCAISGGKDSFLLARLLVELKKHPQIDFDVVFLTMDPGYETLHLDKIKHNAKILEIPLVIKSHNVFEIVKKHSPEDPCYLCARMRRGFLYEMAEKYGCNKVALGHHYDDVIETTLLNMFYAGSFKTMLPKVNSTNLTGLSIIRPLYFVREAAICKIMQSQKLSLLTCGCSIATGEQASERAKMKRLITTLKQKVHRDVDKMIFRSTANVHLDYILEWKHKGETSRYDDE